MNSEELVIAALDYIGCDDTDFFHLVASSGGAPPGMRCYFGTDDIDGEAGVLKSQRSGRCYELAGHAFVTDPQMTDAARLVHGTIHGPDPGMVRIGHAWVNLSDELLWEPTRALIHPRSAWYEWARAHDERTYTIRQARIHMTNTGHYGRWHQSEYR